METNNYSISRVTSFFPVFYCCLIAVFVLLSAIVPAGAQTRDKEGVRNREISREIPNEKKPINVTLPTSPPTANKVLLDKKVDPQTYALGPGDVLSIFIWGNFQGQYQLTVSPEGMLLIPEIGPVDVAGLTIADTRSRVSGYISSKFRNVESIISLVDLRTFKVFVGGAVRAPGAYPATAVTRVSEVIGQAQGLVDQNKGDTDFILGVIKPREELNKVAAKRDIRIYRANGDTLRADILRFDLTGNPDFNPLLMDGDEIFVPVREQLINLYGIFGAVRNPGYFEYSSRDSLFDIISLAHGIAMDADSHSVEIVRFNPDHQSTYNFAVDLTVPGWNMQLFPDDRVFVKPIQGYNSKFQVELVGEFKYPGFYAVSEDSTMLSEIVAKAGGFTDMASLEEAEMIRTSAEEVIDPEFERLKKMNVADMSESEYEYFKIKSRSKTGRVAVDFTRLFNHHDGGKDVYLRDSDVISVPRKRQVVSVTGEVVNPGFLTYVPDKDYNYYIRMAGGYSDRAGKGRVSIIKASTGEWRTAKKGRVLDAGDTVWIPEKKKYNYIGIFKDTALFIGNLATIYLVIKQATN